MLGVGSRPSPPWHAAAIWVLAALFACGCGGGGGGGSPPIEPPPPPPPPDPISLFDAIPASGVSIDPASSRLNIVHLGRPGLRYRYTGACSPTGLAVRRSVTDLGGEEQELVSHQLACTMRPLTSYRITLDATATDGRRYRGELEYSTTGTVRSSLDVVDHVTVPAAYADELFKGFITEAVLDEIDSPVLGLLAAGIVAELAEQRWPNLAAWPAEFGVVSQRVAYTSRDPRGVRAQLSGLVAMPDIAGIGDFEHRDRVVLLEHATGSTPGSLSLTDSWHVLAVLIASHGYLVVAPDNWGRGATAHHNGSDQPETYLMANRVAGNGLDLLAAVLDGDYDEFHDAAADVDVSIVGYSQGGHSAMAGWLASQVGDTGFVVREVYSGGAPHDLYRTFRGTLQHVAGSCDGDPWCRNVEGEAVLPYVRDRILPGLFEYVDVDLDLADVVDGDAFVDEFVTGFLEGESRYDDLKTALQLNSFTNILDPEATLTARDTHVHLYHSAFDRLVPEQNTRDLAELLMPGFDVTHHDACNSDAYEVLFGTVPVVGVVHSVCGFEMLDAVLGDLRDRAASARGGSARATDEFW
ncbi:MAG: hypothetical protein F4X98_17385 [Gammaproteobacteria bacterium]|nr:hypothetical protein [Gammaproteobacteria bacterium]